MPNKSFQCKYCGGSIMDGKQCPGEFMVRHPLPPPPVIPVPTPAGVRIQRP